MGRHRTLSTPPRLWKSPWPWVALLSALLIAYLVLTSAAPAEAVAPSVEDGIDIYSANFLC